MYVQWRRESLRWVSVGASEGLRLEYVFLTYFYYENAGKKRGREEGGGRKRGGEMRVMRVMRAMRVMRVMRGMGRCGR